MNSDTEMGGSRPSFPTTRPSFVAGLASDEAAGRARATEVLVGSYWKPIYKYVRLRFRKENEDAKDLTQGFLAHALETDWLERFDRRRGRFRTFLRLAVDGFVQNDDKARGRLKRGGGDTVLALAFDEAEEELVDAVAVSDDSAQAWFDAEWRRGVFAAVVAELDASSRANGHAVRAALFRRYYLADDDGPRPTYETLAREFDLDVVTITNRLAAARKAFRELLLSRLRAETADEEEYRAELALLLGRERA
ncbi:MAG: hypothetical protein K8S98_15040 [Planctomycetes bacterium]|nr:hypothetical protein [Planctomycetota bacterium]